MVGWIWIFREWMLFLDVGFVLFLKVFVLYNCFVFMCGILGQCLVKVKLNFSKFSLSFTSSVLARLTQYKTRLSNKGTNIFINLLKLPFT